MIARIFFFLSFISLIPSISALSCIERPYPIHPEITVAVECLMVDEPKNNRNNYQVRDNNMFEVKFNCTIPDNKRCAKAKSTFEEAGRIISSTLVLNSVIVINATFREMEPGLLGSAGPFRMIPLKDNDEFERLYPQSLVKQFQFPSHPEFASVDIIGDFNSLMPFWFEGDPPITKDQIGFLELVLHELIHGLGFVSSWRNNFLLAVTPEIIGITTGNKPVDPNVPFVFKGFQENAFDKYLILLPEYIRTSNYVIELNKFANGPGSTFKNIEDFVNQFIASPQYLVAKTMYNYSVNPRDMIFKPSVSNNEDDVTYLETSLDPFQQGSSIAHTDRMTYENTSEFLMTSTQVDGRTLEDSIRVGGNYSGGAIGYKLRLILESLGYATKENPKPYKPSLLLGSSNNNNTGASDQTTSNGTPPLPSSASHKIYHTFIFTITIILFYYWLD